MTPSLATLSGIGVSYHQDNATDKNSNVFGENSISSKQYSTNTNFSNPAQDTTCSHTF